MHVLVVDDDIDFADDLTAAAPEGVFVDVVHTASDALNRIRIRRPDVVILDVRMPPTLTRDAAHEGLAALGAITGGYVGLIPVLVVSELDDESVWLWCGKLGAAAALRKARGLTRILALAADVAARPAT